ncbi:MAG: tetratricopeptide repeat protein [Taibaiella sp.]|nr:tetratricopeptide repeat protein [Taibaiella sp.]
MKRVLFFTALLATLGGSPLYARLKGQAKLDSLLKELPRQKEDSNKVKLMDIISYRLRGTDVPRAMTMDKEAYALSKKINYKYGIARSLNALGVGNYFLENYSEAIIHWQQAKDVYQEIGDLRGVASALSNIGAVYFNQSEYTKAMSLYLEALRIAEKTGDTLRIATVWQNIGAIHNEKQDHGLAIEAFKKALPLFKARKNREGVGAAYLNLGEAYAGQKDSINASINLEEALKYSSGTNYYVGALRTMGDFKLQTATIHEALFYLDSAYKMALKAEDNFELARIVNTIAGAYEKQGNLQKALTYYEQGKSLSQISKSDAELAVSARGLVKIYAERKDYKRAFDNQQILEGAKDSLYNVESDKKNNRMLFNFDLEKKENEIALLVKNKEIQRLEVVKQKGIRNGFIGGFAVVLLFAVVFFGQRNKIKAGKKQSDELLLNILPAEVAEELKAKGSAEAKLIDDVTVLFTDFKGFTQLSEKLTAKELVGEINTCFSAFDNIMQKHGVEKIKTIGDAYMAAGGLPTPNSTHALDVVKAALEIQDFMHRHKEEREAAGKLFFEIRIGVHTGPVVAGIVGIKKFAYDIWGDTVNTASRMESSGTVGKVNISGTTYELVKDKFNCEYRGEVEAKGKGVMKMYFVG